MGFNSTILILNDALDQIKDNPEQFTQAVVDLILKGEQKETRPVGRHGNPVTLVSQNHADATSVVTVGGNCSTVLATVPFIGHTTRIQQIDLIREVAKKYGYRLTKIPEKSK